MRTTLRGIAIGTMLGFFASLVTAFIIGSIYAEQLSSLIPSPVVEAALKVADRVQGYDYVPPKP